MRIQYHGINTNNLRNIDIEFNSGEVIFLAGPSGSGKSSVAIDTIHKISEDELFQLFNSREEVSNYSVRHFENILPSVCLQQDNYNRNPRSTIATYFGLDMFFKQLFSFKNSVSQTLFQFNTDETACESCRGSGIAHVPDPLSITDFSSKVEDIPFRCWRASRSEYYRLILAEFCREQGIESGEAFQSLAPKQQEALLRGESKGIFRIEFRTNGFKHRKTGKYVGPIREMQIELEKDKLPKHRLKYFGQAVCPKCKGARFGASSLTYLLYGKSIAELYMMQIDSLLDWVRGNERYWKREREEDRSFKKIREFLEALVALSLEYLDLNRSIPSLSGGELQRLRLAKAVNSHFRNFLYVFDEPTSGLHPGEWPAIANVISRLKKRDNTLLLIEHNEYLRPLADRVITLGPGGGKDGGRIVANKSGNADGMDSECVFFEAEGVRRVTGAYSNNIQNLSFDFPVGTVVGVCGVSGSGKTSLLRDVLPRYLDNAHYFKQAPIGGNAYSIVATATDLLGHIQRMFSEETGYAKDYFWFSSTGHGQCSTCMGRGVIEEEMTYIKSTLVCPTCGGKRFSAKALKVHFGGANIYEFLSLSVEEMYDQVPASYARLRTGLQLLRQIGLGYLTLFQGVSTVSGGEAQRIKLAGHILRYRSAKQVYLLDEPFRGMDKGNIGNAFQVLYSLVKGGCSVVVSEHNPYALRHCSYVLEMGPGGGNRGGRILFLGKRQGIRSTKESLIASFMS
ncbi:MAG: ATP-binding cassette domain-containing protein [Limisphaerales bacterium]